MTKKEALKQRAKMRRMGEVLQVLYALEYFAPLFVSPHDVAELTGLPFPVVMAGLRKLLRINPSVEADDSANVFKVRSTNLHIRKRRMMN